MKLKLGLALTILTALWLLLAAAPGRAQEDGPGRLQFLESREVTLRLPTGQEQVLLRVNVINGSPAPLDITLELARFANEEHVDIPAEAVIGLPQTASQVEAGQLHMFDAGFKQAAGLTGNYTGELVAVGSDGSVARLPIKLEVQSIAAPAQTSPAQGADPIFLEELNRQALNWLPSPLAFFGLSSILPVQLETSRAFASPRRLVGQVAGEDGIVGLVWQEETRLAVWGLQRAGRYSGKVDLQPGVPGGEMKLNVLVRDFPLYALIALAAGLGIAYWLENKVKIERPQLRLKKKLDELNAEALSKQNSFANNPPTHWPEEWGVFQIYAAPKDWGEPPSLLACEARKIQQKFRDAEGDAERKKWAADGEEVFRVEGYLYALVTMYTRAGELHDYYRRLKTKIKNFDSLPVAEQARSAACADEVFKDKDEFEKAQAGLQKAEEFIEKFYRLYFWLLNLEEIAQGDDLSTVINWRENLESKTAANQAYLEVLEKKVQELATEIEVGYAKRSQPIVPGTVEFPSLKPPIEIRTLARAPRELITETPEETVKRLSDLEWRYRLVSGLVVLGTGFYTLYLANATFGSPYDYLYSLLWGTAIGAGFQIARSLFPSLTA
jgi:hypothetical protein